MSDIRELIENSNCFGVFFFETDGSPCVHADECVVSIQCKKVVLERRRQVKKAQQVKIKKKVRKQPKKGHLRKRPERGKEFDLNSEYLGHQYQEVLEDTFEENNISTQYRSQYINFVGEDGSILFRSFPHKEDILLQIPGDLALECRKYGIRIKDAYEALKKYSRGLDYFVKIKDEDRLKRFIIIVKGKLHADV